jgi:hypothetical protein
MRGREGWGVGGNFCGRSGRVVVGLDLGPWDRLNFILKLDHLLRLVHVGGLLSLRHLDWSLSLGPQFTVHFGKYTEGNRDILNEVVEEGSGRVEIPCSSQPDPEGETRGEAWCLWKAISTERAANRLPCLYFERLVNGKNIESCEMRDIAKGDWNRSHSNPSRPSKSKYRPATVFVWDNNRCANGAGA